MILQLAPEMMPSNTILVEDFVASMQQLQLAKLKKKLSDQKLEMSSYVLLHQPAFGVDHGMLRQGRGSKGDGFVAENGGKQQLHRTAAELCHDQFQNRLGRHQSADDLRADSKVLG